MGQHRYGGPDEVSPEFMTFCKVSSFLNPVININFRDRIMVSNIAPTPTQHCINKYFASFKHKINYTHTRKLFITSHFRYHIEITLSPWFSANTDCSKTEVFPQSQFLLSPYHLYNGKSMSILTQKFYVNHIETYPSSLPMVNIFQELSHTQFNLQSKLFQNYHSNYDMAWATILQSYNQIHFTHLHLIRKYHAHNYNNQFLTTN